MNSRLTVILLIGVIVLFCSYQSCICQLDRGDDIIQQGKEGVVSMKIHFYRWDKIKEERGEYLGEAELIDGKLTFNVSDARLERILGEDFHTMVSLEEEGKMVNKFITYKVGTTEHLQSVIDNCKHISCIGEVVEE